MVDSMDAYPAKPFYITETIASAPGKAVTGINESRGPLEVVIWERSQSLTVWINPSLERLHTGCRVVSSVPA
jgi:hypothetical protein